MPSVTTRIEPISRDIELLIRGDLSPEAQSKVFAGYAREQLAEGQAINRKALGRVPEHDTFVDGAATENLEKVRPNGTIVFEFQLADEMFAWISDQLTRHSPVGRGADKRPGHPGLYQRSHALFMDGVEVDPKGPVPAGDQGVFLALVPYARKIERGLSAQAPAGVYQAVATLASRRFGNVARIAFGYRSPVGASSLDKWASATKMQGKGRQMTSRTRSDWLRRQPAIIVMFR